MNDLGLGQSPDSLDVDSRGPAGLNILPYSVGKIDPILFWSIPEDLGSVDGSIPGQIARGQKIDGFRYLT